MTPEEEISQEILKKFGDKYNLKEVEFKVVVQEKPAKPHDIAPSDSVLEFVGMIGKYFVYLIREGYKKIRFVCTLIAIWNLFTIYVPNGYDFISKYGNQLLDGKTSIVQSKDKEEDGYLALKKSWIEDQNLFQQDSEHYEKGDLGTLNLNDVSYYVSASGINTVIASGTTSSIDLSSDKKT